MSLRARAGAALVAAVIVLLATPAVASAHAYLTHTSPQKSPIRFRHHVLSLDEKIIERATALLQASRDGFGDFHVRHGNIAHSKVHRRHSAACGTGGS